jgi:glycosyltransferase involved in cell wall biosynthesis
MNSGTIPKISIVTPSYNQGEYLEKTILSVLEQGYPNLEYIIIDGKSSDNSVDIIKKYEKYLTYWVSEEDRGQSQAINKGFRHATGDLLAWLNSDDYYSSDTLKIVSEAAMSAPAAGAILGAGEMIDENGNLVHSSSIPAFVTQESLFKWTNDYFWQPSCFFTRQAWELCGPLDEDLHYAMDLDLWLKIANNFPFSIVNLNLSTSLKHLNAKTSAFAYLSVMEAAIVIASHGGGKTVLADLRGYADFLAEKEQVYQQLIESTSWQITAPLRFISSKVRRVLSKIHLIDCALKEK